jgi:hypothetical protein
VTKSLILEKNPRKSKKSPKNLSTFRHAISKIPTDPVLYEEQARISMEF